jgi:hypothetical protein
MRRVESKGWKKITLVVIRRRLYYQSIDWINTARSSMGTMPVGQGQPSPYISKKHVNRAAANDLEKLIESLIFK